MATQVSFGQISIVDISDVGTLSVYPTSNMPLSVIYNPDQNSYTPNWASTNMLLTPVIYYAGRQLTPGSAAGLTVTWTVQNGSSSPAAISSTYETMAATTGVLTVKKSRFTADSSSLSYIVTVSYTDPEVGQTLTAEGKITISLVKHASSQKNVRIIGDTIFKYNSSMTIQGASSITLTAETTNVSISKWQYLNSSNAWTDISNTSGSETLTISATSTTYFVNDRCTVKVVTNDNSVYDVHTIVKLYDGAHGTSTVSAILTNEDQMIPCNASNVPTSYDGCDTHIMIYRGSALETSGWTFDVTPTSVTFQTSADGTTWGSDKTAAVTGITESYFKITAISADTGKLVIKANKSGETPLVKTFSLVKVKAGANGTTATVYEVELSSLVVNVSESGVCTPSTIVCKSYSKSGTSTREAYSGRFKVVDGSGEAIYSSTGNANNYTIPADLVLGAVSTGSMTVQLYKAGALTTLFDQQTVVFTSDGATGSTGPQGNPGVDAVNVVLGNQADVIPCTSANKTETATTITIPFAGYKGITKVACTVATPPKLFNVSATVVNATATADGSITYTIPSGTSVSSATGTISLTFTCQSKTIVHVYRWTRSTAAESTVLFQLYAPNGNIINNGSGSVTLQANLMQGSTDKTSSVTTWGWAKFVGSAYSAVTGSTSTLVVSASDVNGYASYRCQAVYDGTTYTAYYSVIDKTDPLQVTVFSSIGEQIINSQGYGALYVKVARNGDEIDAIKSERFLTAAPSSPSKNDYYYRLDTTNKTVTLKQYNGSSWANVSNPYSGIYAWSFRNKDGEVITPTGISTSGKVIYIDASMINKKLIADVSVTI